MKKYLQIWKNYKIIENKNKIIQNAYDYGVPQDRKRVIIIGVRNDLDYIDVNDIYEDLEKIKINQKKFTVKDAIFDLPKLKPGKEKK